MLVEYNGTGPSCFYLAKPTANNPGKPIVFIPGINEMPGYGYKEFLAHQKIKQMIVENEKLPKTPVLGQVDTQIHVPNKND